MTTRTRAAATALGLTALTVTALAVPAAAGAATPSRPSAGPAAFVPAGRSVRAVPANTASTFLAGYTQPSTDGATAAVSAVLTVPQIKCSGAVRQPLLQTIGVYGHGDADHPFLEDAVLVTEQCRGTNAQYFAQAVADNSTLSDPAYIGPGDRLSITVTVNGDGGSASFVDEDEVASGFESADGYTANGTQFNVQGGVSPTNVGFPSFHPVHFSGLIIDGKHLSPKTSVAHDQVNGQTQITAGPLNSGRSAFLDTYVTNAGGAA